MLEYNIKLHIHLLRWPAQWIGLVGPHKQWAALVAALVVALAEPLNDYNVKL